MKFSCILALLLTGIVSNSYAEDTELESVQLAKWKHQDYENTKLGISVSVKERPKDERKGTSWGSGTFRVTDGDGCKVAVSTQEDDDQIAEYRVPLDSATIEYLLGAKNEPNYVRFIAASHVIDSCLPEENQLKLLKKGIRLPEASLRYYIWHDIRQFKPREKVSDVLHLALRDPCISIAHESLGVVIDAFKLQSIDGSEIKLTTMWCGSLLAYYVVQHREILEVANALHRARPDLMPDEELKTLRGRAMPTDEWFAEYLGDQDAAREYFREYAKKTTAESGPRD